MARSTCLKDFMRKVDESHVLKIQITFLLDKILQNPDTERCI